MRRTRARRGYGCWEVGERGARKNSGREWIEGEVGSGGAEGKEGRSVLGGEATTLLASVCMVQGPVGAYPYDSVTS